MRRPVDPGPHQIVAQATGFIRETRTISLERGSKTTVEIPLLAGAANTEFPVQDRSMHDDLPREGQAQRTWGWAAVGVGSAGLVISGITGVIALQKHSTLDTQCHPGCPVGAADDLSTFRTTRTMSYASFIVGSASLGLGGYLLLAGSGNSPTVGASIGPAHVGLWGRF